MGEFLLEMATGQADAFSDKLMMEPEEEPEELAE